MRPIPIRFSESMVECLRGIMEKYLAEGDVVLCGTHDKDPQVDTDFITTVLPGITYTDVEVPGDGEPGIVVLGDIDPDRQGEILAAFEDWYIAGFPNTDAVDVPDIDEDDIYDLSIWHDKDNDIFFCTIGGCTEYEDDDIEWLGDPDMERELLKEE